MPQTVEKYYAILQYLRPKIEAANFYLSMAAPSVGGRPTTSFVYGDNADDVNTLGGLWWGGNMKGFIYHLVARDQESPADQQVMHLFDHMGVMTYDLCGDPTPICQPFTGATDLSLPTQVNYYIDDILSWLYNAKPGSYYANPNSGRVTFNQTHFQMDAQVLFGVEVNHPAWPKKGIYLQLTNDNFAKILADQQKKTSGLIIWQLYSVTNTQDSGSTVTHVLQESCKTFLAGDSRYDCTSTIF